MNRRILDWLDPDWPPPANDAPATVTPTPAPAPARSALAIRAERTPNPHAMKFEVGTQVGSRTLNDRAAAAGDPLAPLFDLQGVTAVFAVTDFVTVLKTPEARWEELTPEVERVLREVLA